MNESKHYSCVLCKRRHTQKERRKVNDETRRLLEKYFAIFDISESAVICNKCSHLCYKKKQNINTIAQSQRSVSDVYIPPVKVPRPQNPDRSPPSVTLAIPSTSTSHSYCFVCKKPGPKLIVASTYARFRAYIQCELFVQSGSRCCPCHIEDGILSRDALEKIKATKSSCHLNRTSILELLQQAREEVLKKEGKRVDFDDPTCLSDSDYHNLTGLTKEQFDDVLTHVNNIRPTKTRSIRTCLAILLTKLRCGMDNQMLGTIFNMTKYQIRRAVQSARKALMSDFVPRNIGFPHITREEIIKTHTRPLAQHLLSDITTAPAILVLDGTYIYIQKSGNYTFSRRSFSMHKRRPLLKPMMIVSTTGYIVSVLGPYLADPKNNDSSILNHSILLNTEEIQRWIKEDDIFVVDRGFRDSESVLNDLGIRMEMPAFIPKGQKQLSTEEANNSRLVTKVRWVVESVNGRVKTWKYLGKTLPNSQIPYIGDYVRIVCSLCNKYRPPITSGTFDADIAVASKMTMLAKKTNELQQFVLENGLDKRSMKWTSIDADSNIVKDFPRLAEEDIRELTIGVYQLKTAKSYAAEHLTDDGMFEILVSNDVPNIVCAKIQSRHTSAKKYSLWIKYCETIVSWYCTCKNGARVVGMCGHISCIIWYLAFARHLSNAGDESLGIRDWTEDVDDAARAIDSSEDEDALDNQGQEE